MHAVNGAHWESEVIASAFVTYAVEGHVVFLVQPLSERVVGVILSYSLDAHTVRAVQMRSDVSVRLVEIY